MSEKFLNSKFYKNSNYNSLLDLTPHGNPRKALSNTLFGLDHRDAGTATPVEKSNVGLIFFTRPQLNLSIFNLTRSRHLMNLANTDPLSIQRYVRCLLDPRISNAGVEYAYGKTPDGQLKHPRIQISPLLDPYQIFMAVLTNTFVSISGFPDPVLPTYTSKENVRGGQYSIVDGIMDIYNSYDITCTFNNIKDAPVRMIFEYWQRYASLVFDGIIEPYYDMLAANEIDYASRIYRITLDETKQFVKRIGANGWCFPISPDTGKEFNYNKGAPIQEDNNQISVTFKSMGAMYDDPILVDEFNKAVIIGCPPLKIIRAYNIRGIPLDRNSKHVVMDAIPYAYLKYFNYRGYPMIDYQTYELKWYVFKASRRYKEVMKYLNK